MAGRTILDPCNGYYEIRRSSIDSCSDEVNASNFMFILKYNGRDVSDPPPEYHEFLMSSKTCAIALKPLQDDDIVKILCEHWKVNRVSPNIASMVTKRAGGMQLHTYLL
jgi:hypothetical protein